MAKRTIFHLQQPRQLWSSISDATVITLWSTQGWTDQYGLPEPNLEPWWLHFTGFYWPFLLFHAHVGRSAMSTPNIFAWVESLAQVQWKVLTIIWLHVEPRRTIEFWIKFSDVNWCSSIGPLYGFDVKPCTGLDSFQSVPGSLEKWINLRELYSVESVILWSWWWEV